jgi:hypothetical protein
LKKMSIHGYFSITIINHFIKEVIGQ